MSSLITKETNLEKTLKRLQAIEDISEACSNFFTLDLSAVAKGVLKAFCELTEADYGLFFLLKNTKNKLYVEAAYGLPDKYQEVRNKEKILTIGLNGVDDNWPSIRSMLEKRIVVIKNLEKVNMSFSKFFTEIIKPNKIISAAAVPIIVNDKSVGAIAKYYVKPHNFDNEEMSFMKTTANMIRNTMERNHLLELSRRTERELTNANEILRQVNKELDSFVYIASHDLREPLRTIESFVSILQDKLKENLNEEKENYFLRIVCATQKMRRLIEDLTNLSQASRSNKENEKVDLNLLLTEVQFELTAFIKNQNANVLVVDRLPPVIGNKEKVSSIFKNLITNGIKFNKSKEPHVKISLAEDLNFDPEKVCICTEDNGIGIESEYHKKIFGLFQRLHTQEEYEGTGAGLAIVKKILEKYNCEIWLESQENKGSRFYFTLNRAT